MKPIFQITLGESPLTGQRDVMICDNVFWKVSVNGGGTLLSGIHGKCMFRFSDMGTLSVGIPNMLSFDVNSNDLIRLMCKCISAGTTSIRLIGIGITLPDSITKSEDGSFIAEVSHIRLATDSESTNNLFYPNGEFFEIPNHLRVQAHVWSNIHNF